MPRLSEKSTLIGLGILLMEGIGWYFPEAAAEVRMIAVPLLAGLDVVRRET